jgi:hypothetical protein
VRLDLLAEFGRRLVDWCGEIVRAVSACGCIEPGSVPKPREHAPRKVLPFGIAVAEHENGQQGTEIVTVVEHEFLNWLTITAATTSVLSSGRAPGGAGALARDPGLLLVLHRG